MRFTQLFLPTVRELPAEAEAVSHRLMLKAGLIRKLASGVYAFSPLGYRSLRKIEGIIRDEMEKMGAQEVQIPALLPAETFRQSGRWESFGPEMFKLKDRSGREFCLAPAVEEAFTETVKYGTRSYRSFPLCLYQIQTKYRDENKPRLGVMRSREFVMQDAYSFDRDEKGLEESYKRINEAYCRIFKRCGLQFISAEADSGTMQEGGSTEFIVKSEVGEAIIARCEACGYSSNVEVAAVTTLPQPARADEKEPSIEKEHTLEKVETPECRTIEDLIHFFKCSPERFAKTLIYKAGDRVIAAMVRGDRELNELKLQRAAGCSSLEMADSDTVKMATGAETGFAGPVGLRAELYIDVEVANTKNLITGANETGFHLLNVNMTRDFKGTVADIRKVVHGDPCPRCGSKTVLENGIEVGKIAKLGTKYSSVLNCVYLDENGQEQPVNMGSYAIGINRAMAAVIECNNDENGIIWKVPIAPYHIVIIPVSNDPVPQKLAEELYVSLKRAGAEVLLDDRNDRAGVKFKDADLIGIPVRITVGRKAAEGIVELKFRNIENKEEMDASEAVDRALAYIKEQLK